MMAALQGQPHRRAALALAAVVTALACDVHVNVNTIYTGAADGSATRPFSGIGAAQAHVRQLRRSWPHGARTPAAATTICLAGGVYRESLTFTAEDSGSPGSPIIYTSLPGQNVSLTGAWPISFQPLPASDPARGYVSPAVGAALWMADLVADAVPNITEANTWLPRGFDEGCQVAPMELVWQGGVQTVARWPNVNQDLQETTTGFKLTEWPGGDGLSNRSFWADPSTAPFLSYKDTGNMWFHGFWKYEWSDSYALYGGASSTGSSGSAGSGGAMAGGLSAGSGGAMAGGLVNVSFAPGTGMTEVIGSARYYAVNALDALDSPGEYYINSTIGRLYFYPPAGATDTTGEVTVNTTLISATGTTDVWFAGITIESARGHGVELTSTARWAFLNVTWRNLGQDALRTYQSNDTLVSGSSMVDTGCAGARFMDGGDRLSLTPSGNIIVDSTVTRNERLCFTYNAAVSLDTGGVCAHNHLSDSPHNAVTLSGNDVLIQGNVITNTTRLAFDNGAIYFYPCDWTAANTTIRYNLLYLNAQDRNTCNSFTSCGRHAIYPDNGNAFVNVLSNVVWQPAPASYGHDIICPHCTPYYATYALFNDGGRGMLASNNVFVMDGANVSFNGAAGLTWDASQRGNSSSYFTKMQAVGWNTGLYAQRYLALAQLQDYWPVGDIPACAADPNCGAAPWGNVVAGNVLVNFSTLMTYPPPSSSFDPSNFNITNNWQGLDPGWADPDPRSSLNFQLADNSPVYSSVPGFTRIPMECFGPGKRCPGEPDWGAEHRRVLQEVWDREGQKWTERRQR